MAAEQPTRVVIEVRGGCVQEVYGDVDFVVCDWDNFDAGDTFDLKDEWKDDPTLSDFVNGSYVEMKRIEAEEAEDDEEMENDDDDGQ